MVLLAVVAIGAAATAQDGAPEPPPEAASGGGGEAVTLWVLFRQSFDFFTITLVTGSMLAWGVIGRCAIEIREANILPARSEQMIRQLGSAGKWKQVKQFVADDRAFVSIVLRAAMGKAVRDKDAAREAGELAASEECARLFRKIEPLNIIGSLGPLLGLCGTVWGMVIAFAALGQTGGQSSPASLSLGISKALFHTLLGLFLAVPALAVFGFYRGRVDRLCNRAMSVSGELVELLPPALYARLPSAAHAAAPAPAPAPASGNAPGNAPAPVATGT